MEITQATAARSEDAYVTIGLSFVQAIQRLSEARSGSLALLLATRNFRKSGESIAQLHGPHSETLQVIRGITDDELESFEYITNVSLLVYATTLLDTFLTDTLRFLFLLFPGAMGSEGLSLKQVLNAASKTAIVSEAATRKAREVAFGSFPERIKFLRKRFHLSVALTPQATEALKHFAELRNLAVHDQAVFDVALDESGIVQVTQKAHLRRPTPLTADDVRRAVVVYRVVGAAVFIAIVRRVLKQVDDATTAIYRALLSQALTQEPDLIEPGERQKVKGV
jgi:hypothetical protein